MRYWRECLLEGNGSLGKHLPVLQFASNLGWYVRGTNNLTTDFKADSWLQSSNNLFRWRHTDPWVAVHASLGHSRPLALNNLKGDADAERFHRFIGAAYGRFVAEEPEVASLWREGNQLMCGWDPLPPEDGRLPSRKRPENLPIFWFGYTEWIHLDEWTWRVERNDLRYDGVYADE